MSLNIHILEEDLAGWGLTRRAEMVAPLSSSRYHYKPRIEPSPILAVLPRSDSIPPEKAIELEERIEVIAERIQLIAPEPLKDLVGRNMDCFVKVVKTGAHPEVNFHLKYPELKREPRDPRRLRLRIK